MSKNILIYTHMSPFDSTNGGLTALYNLAKILEEYNQNVFLHSENCIENPIFNKYDNTFEIDDETIVIYCEGTQGNPLNAKKVVRWMLSELGQNVPVSFLETWSNTDFVYYFNSEKKMYATPEKIGTIYKLLTTLYLPTEVQQHNFKERKGICYTYRKAENIHKNGFKKVHPKNAFEITREHSLIQCVNVFNRFKWFMSYDSLTFYIIISALCGCIPVVYKIDGLSKKDWIQTTAAAEYCRFKGIDNLYGIAYGQEEMSYAEETIHLVKEQWNDILQFNKDSTVLPFIQDIENYENMQNTIENNFFEN